MHITAGIRHGTIRTQGRRKLALEVQEAVLGNPYSSYKWPQKFKAQSLNLEHSRRLTKTIKIVMMMMMIIIIMITTIIGLLLRKLN